MAALRHGAFDVAVDATTAGQVERARDWLLIRDFHRATRFTRPGVDATTALDQLERGEITAEEAVIGIHQRTCSTPTRLVSSPTLDEAEQAVERHFDAALAGNAALAASYWSILADLSGATQPGERKREDANFKRALATAPP